MNFREAVIAIEEILKSIPDSELPKFDKVEMEDGLPIVWWASSGYHLGKTTRNGKREPLVYRQNAATDAIEGEMIYRADQRLFDNGDDPTGINFMELLK